MEGLLFVLTLGFAAMLCGHAGAGEHPGAGFTSHSIGVEGRAYPYAVYRAPGLDPGTPARGLVFLHGRGECGTDGKKMLTVGLPPAIEEDPARWPFVVLIPQKPTGESEWEDHERALLAMLDRVIEEHNVHPGRVAITGLSQGGHGSISLASRLPGRFRAAAPVCGYVRRAWVDGEHRGMELPEAEEADALIASLRVTPIWLFHGGKDAVVPPAQSQWLHRRLQDVDAASRLTIFPEDAHNSWDSAYRESGLAEWLVKETD